MKFSSDCVVCLVNKMNTLNSQHEKSLGMRLAFIKKVLNAIYTADKDISPPELYGELLGFF